MIMTLIEEWRWEKSDKKSFTTTLGFDDWLCENGV